jgi:argininosuccinate lyase
MEKFNASIQFDKCMWREDIQGSKAYASALAETGIITKEERDQLLAGLDKVGAEWEAGTFVITASDEDIHTANERRLTEFIGSVGGKLHTGRSRNDQVAVDVRLWLVTQLRTMQAEMGDLLNVLCDRAEGELDVMMPGFTHLQPAQPVRWAHWLMSYAAMLQRDHERLTDTIKRTNRSPLGSGALAGNPFGVDRQAIALALGMEGVCPNSMDAVSDRDFIAECLFVNTMITTHLSKFSEDLIIYSSGQFGFVQLSDAYSTGSSLMPQKKNPDALELLRGKAGRTLGSLTGFLAVLKGTPSTYNKDLQEDKEALFDSVQTLHDSILIATGVISTLTIRPERMITGLSPDMLATDLAEYLVRKGIPFRDTHHISGACVKAAEDAGKGIDKLTLEELQGICEHFGPDVVDIFNYKASADRRDSEGGTSERSVVEQIAKMRAFLGK